ncbi:MAG: hypothetical protein M2R45_02751 [Verrucomicrobia subdivision 3 bacterium]|nr:hypothetical protein [Limisphaerales bacterium]MCS1414301.1 hypothetical protein [Limisphaerales bacterium]
MSRPWGKWLLRGRIGDLRGLWAWMEMELETMRTTVRNLAIPINPMGMA